MHREKAIFLKLRLRVIRAIDRGHEVRIVEEKRQEIERDAPRPGIRACRVKREQEKRRRPCAAANEQIDPGIVNPGALRRNWRSRRLLRRGCQYGAHLTEE